ncbi:MAG: histidine kinase [Verrucomicrobiales bacterium]|nr:histidine kinase [Verrucomicrobiales bacterium]
MKQVSAFFAGLWLAALAAGNAAPVVDRIAVDGNVIVSNGQAAEIPSSAQKIVLYVRDSTEQAAGNFSRVRYRLQGVDGDWKQAEGGSATFTVCFYDQTGTRFGHKTFEVKGVSPVWDKKLVAPAFTTHREQVMVPENAERISFIISSAGSPSSVGVYAVKNITIIGPNGQPLFDGMSAMPFRQSGGVKKAEWIADGTHRSMAQILSQPDNSILAIIDDDNTGHAEWRLGGELPKVRPGEQLLVQWEETYETGPGELKPIEYDRLAPGHYVFSVQDVDVWGEAQGGIGVFEFSVSAPYWERPWFWVLCIGAVNVLVLLLWRYRIYLKARRLDSLNQERLRIAQDLHDDLGSYITHISLLSSYAETQPSTPESLSSLREISKVTRNLVAALSETVWMVNPKNDNLESLVGFLCRHIEQQCMIAKVRCRINALALTDYREVPSNLRHHIILAVKEALNNALKHSGTKELHARIAFENSVLHIVIGDQGKGFYVGDVKQGNGLTNMQRRMEVIGGKFSIESNEGKGTTVRFAVPIA